MGKIDLETISDLVENPENTMENLAATKQELERKIAEYEEDERRKYAEENDDDEDDYDYQLEEEEEEDLRREKEWNDYMDEIYEKRRREVLIAR